MKRSVVRNCVCVQCQRALDSDADLVVVDRASDAPLHPTAIVHPDAYLAFVEDHGENLDGARASVKRWSARWA